MKYFDTHAHYNDKVYKENLDEVLNECIKKGVEYIVNVGASINESLESIELARKYPYIFSSIGIHPQNVKTDKVQDLYDMYTRNVNGKVVAVGEIGLDYHYTKDEKQIQKKVFIEQIELANTLKLPILIHTRDASLDTYEVIKNEKQAKYGTLFHCFNPTDDLMRLILKNDDYMVAFGGNITYKRSASFYDYIKQIPLSKIVVETDAPYLPPVPLRGTINTSSNLEIICNNLAKFKDIEEEKTKESVFNNAIRFYNIKNIVY